MAGTPYSAAEMARIRTGYLAMEALADIAAAVGRSPDTVRAKAKRMGLSNEARQQRHAREKLRERHQVEGYTASLLAKAQSPEARAKRTATLKAKWAQPGYREHARIRRERAWAERRGFAVPAAKKERYDLLIRKKIPAREAARMLGFLPAGESAR